MAEKGFSAALTDLGLGSDIPIVNLHMEAGDGPQDREVRAEGVRFMIDYLVDQFDDKAMIVAGDFNLHGDSEEDVVNLDLLKTELNIEDACEVLECGDDRIDRVFFRSGPNLELEALQWEIPSHFIDTSGAPLSRSRPYPCPIQRETSLKDNAPPWGGHCLLATSHVESDMDRVVIG